jgi:hypothetical protein
MVVSVRNTVFLDVTPLFCMFPGKYFCHPSSFSDTCFSHCFPLPSLQIHVLSAYYYQDPVFMQLTVLLSNWSSNFLWNVDNFYQVTWCHIPDDNILHYFSTVSVDSKNCEKYPCLSVHHHGTTLSPLDEFSWNLISEYFLKSLSKNHIWLKSESNNEYFTFMISLWILLKIRNYRMTKVLQKIKTHTLRSIHFLWKSCSLWDNVEKYDSRTGHRWCYSMVYVHCMLDN